MMADYYPLLASVMTALETSSAELRRRLYESARTGFLEQMSKHDPPLNQSYIKQEQIALEEAIRRIEAEQVSRRAQLVPPIKDNTARTREVTEMRALPETPSDSIGGANTARSA